MYILTILVGNSVVLWLFICKHELYMSRMIFTIAIVLFCSSSLIFAQNSKYEFSISKLEKGEKYCDDLDYRTVIAESTFVFCRSVYSFKYDYRKAYNIIALGQKKFPYSYQIRLQKALALQELGSTNDATNELIGLLQLYPDKADLHNFLGRVQYKQDRVKALMPLLLSVYLNPKTKESEENLIFIKRLFAMDNKPKKIKSKTPMKLGITGIDNFDWVNYRIAELNSEEDASELPTYLIHCIDNLGNALYKSPHLREGFFWNYYANYFIELHQQGLVEDFVQKMLSNNTFHSSDKLQHLNSSFRIE